VGRPRNTRNTALTAAEDADTPREDAE